MGKQRRSTEECGKGGAVRDVRKTRTEREEWWWKDEIQLVLKEKKELKKRWEQTRLQAGRVEYQRKKKEAKRAVAMARAEAASELYEELETVEGQKKIYRIAKYRNKATKDISHVKQMEVGRCCGMRRDSERVKERWKEYFENLLNEEYPREQHQNGTPNQGLTIGVTGAEVESALRKMKNNKATGPDEIPVEAWRALGGEGVDLLWDLMIKIEEHIPDEWRESVLVPIYKEKGDVQECQNYRGIKLLSHTMKIWERIVDKRLRGEVEVAEEQFGFMPGRGTTNTIFILRQMAEKYREKGRDLHMVFIDLRRRMTGYRERSCGGVWGRRWCWRSMFGW